MAPYNSTLNSTLTTALNTTPKATPIIPTIVPLNLEDIENLVHRYSQHDNTNELAIEVLILIVLFVVIAIPALIALAYDQAHMTTYLRAITAQQPIRTRGHAGGYIEMGPLTTTVEHKPQAVQLSNGQW